MSTGRQQYSIAVAGATGDLGQIITKTLLTTYRPFFPRVLALTRSSSSSSAQSLSSLGAEIHEVAFTPEGKDGVKEALKGIDVLVNALGNVKKEVLDVVGEAGIEAGVVVYFASEFGVDHRLSDFPGFEHPDWTKKVQHADHIEALAKSKVPGRDVKIVSLYNGGFLEDFVGYLLPKDPTAKITLRTLSSTARSSYTSKHDIASSVAQLALILLKPYPTPGLEPAPGSLKVYARIAGTTLTTREFGEALARGSVGEGAVGTQSAKEVEVLEDDVTKVKNEVKEKVLVRGEPAGPLFLDYLNIVSGEGKLDFSDDNVNEIVNPKERNWRWRSVEEVVKERKTV